MQMKFEAMLVSLLLGFSFLDIVASHSWIDCTDYDVATQTCKGRPRNWYKRPATPFGQDVGRDIRPGKDVPQGLFCDPQKERINSPVSAGYDLSAPMARLVRGRQWTMTWPAKNHADVGKQRGVQIFISKVPGGGDDFSHITSKAAWVQKYPELQKTFSNCNPPGPNNDRAFCMGTFTLPGDLAPGVYTLMWWWEFNAGEFYNSCADIEVIGVSGTAPAVTTTTLATTVAITTTTSTTISKTSTASETASFTTITTTAKTTTLATTGLITSTSAATIASTVASRTTTVLSTTGASSCDANCVDTMGSAACRRADVMWNMCSSGNSWWTSQCQATCATCGGVLPPCGQCDHRCTNLRSESDCETRNRGSAGALCSGGWGLWWVNQCRVSCGACVGRLPPCGQTVQMHSYLDNVPASMGSNPQVAGQGQVMSSCFTRIVQLLPLAVIIVSHGQA